MTGPSGLGQADIVILEATARLTPDRGPGAASARVLTAVEEAIGLGPRHGYGQLLDLARPWMLPLPLVQVLPGRGDRVFPPEPAADTWCRLSQAGQVVLDAEAGSLPPVPADLINGTTWKGGTCPALDAGRVLDILRRLASSQPLASSEILRIAGPPVSAAGCDLAGDLDALAAGQRVMLRETGKITVTGHPVPAAPPQPSEGPPQAPRLTAGMGRPFQVPHLVIESLPAASCLHDVIEEINNRRTARVERHGWLPDQATLPVADIWDDPSSTGQVRIEITLRPGSDPHAVRDQLTALDGITTQVPAQFPAPLAVLLREWAARHAQDTTAGLAPFETAIEGDREREQASW